MGSQHDALFSTCGAPVLMEHFGDVVEYRGEGVVLTFQAIQSPEAIELHDGDGAMETWIGVSFAFPAASLLKTDLSQFKPAKGHEILASGRLYAVTPPPGKRASEPLDNTATRIKVYAVYIGDEVT